MKNIAKQRGLVLVVLLGAMFLGGAAVSGTTFVKGISAKDIKKTIKEVVTDEIQRKETVSLIDEWKKEGKKYRKQVKNEQKELLKVLKSFSASRDVMQQAAKKLNDSIENEDRAFLDVKMGIREKLTEEEWKHFWARVDK